jgi:thiol:disulfide interchange protein DsbD
MLVLMVATSTGAPAADQVQMQGPPQPVKWSMAVEPESASVEAGATLKAVVTTTIDDGWHVYAPDEANSGPRPVTVTVTANPVFAEAGSLDAPEPEREMDEAFGQITASYAHQAVFRLPVRVAATAPAGTHPLKLEISFQACDGRMCLPARVVRLEAPVTVTR